MKFSYFYITFSPEFQHTQHTDFMKVNADRFDEAGILREYEAEIMRNKIGQPSRLLHHARVRGPFESLKDARQDRDQLIVESQSFANRVSPFIVSTSSGTGLFSFRITEKSILRVWFELSGSPHGTVRSQGIRDIVTLASTDPRVHVIDAELTLYSDPLDTLRSLKELVAQSQPALVVLTVLADLAGSDRAAEIETLIKEVVENSNELSKFLLVHASGSDAENAVLQQPGQTMKEEPSGKIFNSVTLRINAEKQVNDELNLIGRTINTMLDLSSPELVINEAMSSNVGIFVDRFGNDGDWIEIYNMGNKPVDLSGMYITDDSGRLMKWRIPLDENPNADVIQAKAYKVIWADGDTGKGADHAAFKLNRNGEDIALTDLDGTTVIDFVTLGRMGTNQSFGRVPDGEGAFVEQGFPGPTPGAPNGAYLRRGSIGGDHIFPSDIRIHIMDRKSNIDRNGVPYLDSFAKTLSVFTTTAFEIKQGWTTWTDVTDAAPDIIILHINGFEDAENPARTNLSLREFVVHAAATTDASFIFYSGAPIEPGSRSSDHIIEWFTTAANENGIDVSGRLSTFALNWEWRTSPFPNARYPDPRIELVLKQMILQQYMIAKEI